MDPKTWELTVEVQTEIAHQIKETLEKLRRKARQARTQPELTAPGGLLTPVSLQAQYQVLRNLWVKFETNHWKLTKDERTPEDYKERVKEVEAAVTEITDFILSYCPNLSVIKLISQQSDEAKSTDEDDNQEPNATNQGLNGNHKDFLSTFRSSDNDDGNRSQRHVDPNVSEMSGLTTDPPFGEGSNFRTENQENRRQNMSAIFEQPTSSDGEFLLTGQNARLTDVNQNHGQYRAQFQQNRFANASLNFPSLANDQQLFNMGQQTGAYPKQQTRNQQFSLPTQQLTQQFGNIGQQQGDYQSNQPPNQPATNPMTIAQPLYYVPSPNGLIPVYDQQGRGPEVNIGYDQPRSKGFKIADLKLKPFGGDFSDYKNFRRSFMKLHEVYDDGEKLEYLREKLIGPPFEEIRYLDNVPENYEVAWQILDEAYNNERFQLENSLRKLFNIPVLYGKNLQSIKTFKQEINGVLYNLRAQEVSWEDIVSYCAVNKMDPRCQDEFYGSIQPLKRATAQDLVQYVKRKEQSFSSSINDPANPFNPNKHQKQ